MGVPTPPASTPGLGSAPLPATVVAPPPALPATVDLAGGNVSAPAAPIAEYEIRMGQDRVWYKRLAFGIALAIAIGFYYAFMVFVFKVPPTDTPHERLVLAGFLAGIPTIILLAIVRFAFAEPSKPEEVPDYSILQALGKECWTLLKSLVEKKKD